MTRQSRLLLTMAILAVAGVAALGMIANRYAAVIQRQEEARERVRAVRVQAEPLQQIDRLIAVETAVRRAGEEGTISAEALDAVRRRALAGAGLQETDYWRLLRQCRQWKTERGDAVPRPYRLAFERRRSELGSLCRRDAP